jgi:rRNA maturation protein Nop10
MKGRMRICGQGHYSLKAECPVCGEKSHTPHPARFAIQDPHGFYRRKALK